MSLGKLESHTMFNIRTSCEFWGMEGPSLSAMMIASREENSDWEKRVRVIDKRDCKRWWERETEMKGEWEG